MRSYFQRTSSAIGFLHLSIALLLYVALAAPPLFSQTKVDVRTQSKSIDFSAANSTKPAQMGSVVPAVCTQGQFFFLMTAPAGQNVYGCSATNTWSLEGSAVPSTSLVPAELNKAGTLLTTDGTNPVWQTIGGDVSGSPATLRVGALLGRTLSTTAPANGQLLEFNSASGSWTPLAIAGDVTGAPGALQVAALLGRTLSTLVPSDGQLLQYNGTTGQWTPLAIAGDISGKPSALVVGALQGRALSTAVPADGQLLKFNASAAQWQPIALGGDVSGTPSALVVGALQGRALSTAVPADGQLLKFNASAAQWQPIALGGDVSGTPSALVVGALQGRALSTAVPADGQLLKFNASAAQWQPIALGGDVSGAPTALTVSGLQGRSVSSTAATAGQLLSWSAGSNAWTPSTLQIPPNYNGAFTSATSVTIAGTQHNLNTSNLTVDCYDNASPANHIEPGQVTVDPVSFNVIVTFAQPQTGRCVVNGSGGVGLTSGVIAAGAGIAVSSNGSVTTIATNTATVPMYFTGTATLTFPAIANAACATELTIAVPAAQPGDGVAEGWPSLPAGLVGMMRVSTAGSVAVRLCNLSGAALTPASLVYKATVVGTPN